MQAPITSFDRKPHGILTDHRQKPSLKPSLAPRTTLSCGCASARLGSFSQAPNMSSCTLQHHGGQTLIPQYPEFLLSAKTSLHWTHGCPVLLKGLITDHCQPLPMTQTQPSTVIPHAQGRRRARALHTLPPSKHKTSLVLKDK